MAGFGNETGFRGRGRPGPRRRIRRRAAYGSSRSLNATGAGCAWRDMMGEQTRYDAGHRALWGQPAWEATPRIAEASRESQTDAKRRPGRAQ